MAFPSLTFIFLFTYYQLACRQQMLAGDSDNPYGSKTNNSCPRQYNPKNFFRFFVTRNVYRLETFKRIINDSRTLSGS